MSEEIKNDNLNLPAEEPVGAEEAPKEAQPAESDEQAPVAAEASEAEEVEKAESAEQEHTPDDESSQKDEETSDNKNVKKKGRKKLTPEQKKKRAKKALIAVGAIVLVLALFVSGLAIGNTVVSKALLERAKGMTQVVYDPSRPQLVPQGTTRGDDEWTYFELPEGRDFKILQLTDVHIGGGSFSQSKDAWAMSAVAKMVDAEKPDLVIVTGDICFPVPYAAATFNNLSGIKIFSEMMESLGVYWTFAFGNHDTEAYSMYSRKDVTEYFEKSNFKYCLYERGFSDDEDKFGKIDRGFGNHIINVKKNGKVIQSLVMLDSHSYTDGDYFGIAWKYDNIHQSQVDWYKKEMDKINEANDDGQKVKNLAFFHIPLVEYREAWKVLRDMRAKTEKDLEKGDFATVPANEKENRPEGTSTYYYGVMGESEKERHGIQSYGIFCGYQTDTLFETGLEYGMQGMFCGHDHYNNFSIEYMGIRLTYGMSIDYLAYPGIFKEHSQRGCTVITVDKDGAFDCEPRNYYEDYGVAHEKD